MSQKAIKAIVAMVLVGILMMYTDHLMSSRRSKCLLPEANILEKLHIETNQTTIRIATQVCANRYGEIITMLKSILLLTKAHLMIYLFVDKENENSMNEELGTLKKKYPDNLSYKIRLVSYPGITGRNLFAEKTKPCAITRVFLPRLLPDVDSVLFLDTDMLFFHPIEELWWMFTKFNSSQVIGIAPDNPSKVNWYNTRAKHPYYGSAGLNTGVMLMNLTRLRKIDYTSIIVDLFNKWHTKIMWGEQDIHNIWFHYHPEKVYLIPCEWNYRDEHCVAGNACEGAEKNGIYVLHGNGQRLLFKKFPELFAINNAFLKHLSSENAKEEIAKAVKQNLANLKKVTKCTREFRRLYKNLKLP